MKRLDPAWTAVALVALVRVLIAMSRVDEHEIDLYSGSFAWALVHGMPLDLGHLPVIPHSRGSVVIGLLLVPFYAVFGPRLFLIRTMAIAFSCITAFLFVRLLQRHIGRGAAWTGALLYAVLPPSFQMVDVLALGSHGDSILLTLFALSFLLRPTPEGRERPRMRNLGRVALFGTICGLGYFCSMQVGVALPALFACWLALEGRQLLERRWLWKGALAFGLPFGLFYGLAKAVTGTAVIVNKTLDKRLLPDGIGGALAKFADTWTYQIRRSWLFEENGGGVWSWGYAAAAVAGLLLVVVTLRRRPRPLPLFLVLYALLLVTAYAVLDFEMNFDAPDDGMGSRYMMPVCVLAVGWIAFASQALLDRFGVVAASAFVAVPLVCGGAGVLSLLDPGRALDQPSLRGTEFPYFHDHFQHAGGDDASARLALIDELDPDWKAFRPLCYELALVDPPEEWTDPVLWPAVRAALTEEPELRRYLLVQMGFQASAEWAQKRGRSQWGISMAEDILRGDDLIWFMRGVGKQWAMLMTNAIKYQEVHGRPIKNFANFAALNSLNVQVKGPLLEGIGFQIGYRTTPYQRLGLGVLEEAEKLPIEFRRIINRCFGWGYRIRFMEASYVAPDRGALRIERFMRKRSIEFFHEGLRWPYEVEQ